MRIPAGISRFKGVLGSAGLLLTMTALFWGGNTVAGRLAVGEVSPLLLVFLRWVLVIVVLWPLYGGEVRAHWPEIRRRLPRHVLMGALGYTGFNALFYYAAHHTVAINMGLLQGSIPAFVLLGAFLAHGVRPGLRQLLGVAITIVGVAVVATRGNPLSLLEVDFNRGDLALILACIFYAFYTVMLRDRPQLSGAAFFTLLAVISAVTSVPLVAFEALAGELLWPTFNGWLILIWIAIFPSCLAQLFYLAGVDQIGPGRAGVYVNLVPVFSAMLAVAVLSEPFSFHHALALVMVIGGIALGQRTSVR